MRVLVLDHNRANGLTQALQLSSCGLTVETVLDVEEAARRLSAMTFDAVLYNLPVRDLCQSERMQAFREFYPDTEFYTPDTIDDFLKRIRKDTSSQ
jgi:CheY-like chemotaxis protein